jgi:hypothetical protein
MGADRDEYHSGARMIAKAIDQLPNSPTIQEIFDIICIVWIMMFGRRYKILSAAHRAIFSAMALEIYVGLDNVEAKCLSIVEPKRP